MPAEGSLDPVTRRVANKEHSQVSHISTGIGEPGGWLATLGELGIRNRNQDVHRIGTPTYYRYRVA